MASTTDRTAVTGRRSFVVAGLARRRQAAARMEPLPFDRTRRDPLEPEESERRPAVYVRLDRYSAHLTGPTAAIFTAAKLAKVPAMRRAMATDEVSVPIAYADDILCQLQFGQGHPVYFVPEQVGAQQ